MGVLALGYLAIPAIVVAVTFGTPLSALLAIAAVLAALFARSPGSISAIPLWERRLWPLYLCSLLVVVVMGIFPPFGERGDWLKHYALLNLLAGSAWPPRVEVAGVAQQLHYYLSWYIFPGAVGLVLGSIPMRAALFIWTWLGITIGLVLLVRSHRTPALIGLVCATFVLFSGADIIGHWMLRNVSPASNSQLEWWAEFGEVSSNLTSLIWVPQHSIPALIATALFLREPQFAVRNGLPIACVVSLWSPFATLGLIPVAVVAMLAVGPREVFSRSNLIVGPLAALTVLVFYLPHTGLSAQLAPVWTDSRFSLLRYTALLGLEVWLPATLCLLALTQQRALVLTCAAFLTGLSLITSGGYNDLLMRAAIPSVMVLGIVAAEAIAGDRRKAIPLIVFLAFGAITPISEFLAAALLDTAPPPHQITLRNIPEVYWPQYLIPAN